jgi:hypothetical protein
MPTSSFVKFDCWVEDCAHGVHTLNTAALKVALVAAANAPDTATDAVLADLTEISYTNASSRDLTTASSGQTAGTYKLVLDDLSITASGGDVGPFRYAVIYNDSAASDNLIGVLDWGSDLTLSNGQSFDLDFDAVDGAITLT